MRSSKPLFANVNPSAGWESWVDRTRLPLTPRASWTPLGEGKGWDVGGAEPNTLALLELSRSRGQDFGGASLLASEGRELQEGCGSSSSNPWPFTAPASTSADLASVEGRCGRRPAVAPPPHPFHLHAVQERGLVGFGLDLHPHPQHPYPQQESNSQPGLEENPSLESSERS